MSEKSQFRLRSFDRWTVRVAHQADVTRAFKIKTIKKMKKRKKKCV